MLTALALSLLATAPATGLTLSAQLGKSKMSASAWLDAVEKELIAVGVPVRRLALQCDGGRECLLAGAKAAQLPAVVGMSVISRAKETTIDLEALRTRDGESVAQLTFGVSEKLGEKERAAVRTFAAQLLEAIAVTPVPDVPVAEVRPTLEPPRPPEPPPEVLVAGPPPLPPRRSRVPGWLLAGGAAAAGVTSGIFLGSATVTRTNLESTPDHSSLTRALAEQRAAEANRDYTVALATGLAAGALATAAIVWFVTD